MARNLERSTSSATIAQNIAFMTAIEAERVREAAKIALAGQFYCSLFRMGMRPRVGEKGAQISGGQRQRLVIARAVCKQTRRQIRRGNQCTRSCDGGRCYRPTMGFRRPNDCDTAIVTRTGWVAIRCFAWKRTIIDDVGVSRPTVVRAKNKTFVMFWLA